MLGGIGATRLAGRGKKPAGLAPLVSLLALSHATLVLGAHSLYLLGVLITIAGMTIAPAVARAYAMVDEVALEGTQTEAFSWLLAAALTGGSLGSVAAGIFAQSAGPAATFESIGVGSLATVAILAVRRSTLRRESTPSQALSPTSVSLPPRAHAAQELQADIALIAS